MSATPDPSDSSPDGVGWSAPADTGSGHTVPCKRCGVCCQAHIALLTRPEDIQRWRRQGRADILRVVEAETQDTDGMGDNALMAPCPYLEWEGCKRACAIYDTRPLTCRAFRPGSGVCSQHSTGLA
jgi:Fe-S-cluster containining protein